MKDRPFQLTDIVRETSYAIHRYHGRGHLEKVLALISFVLCRSFRPTLTFPQTGRVSSSP